MRCENWPGEFGINGLVFRRNRAFGNRSSRIICNTHRWNLLGKVGDTPGVGSVSGKTEIIGGGAMNLFDGTSDGM